MLSYPCCISWQFAIRAQPFRPAYVSRKSHSLPSTQRSVASLPLM
jgi:hypothetical protein